MSACSGRTLACLPACLPVTPARASFFLLNPPPATCTPPKQSVQYSWAAFAAAGLGGAYMGYLKSVRDDEERKVENERVQRLEQEKMRREAEAVARLAEERKKARLREQAVARTVSNSASVGASGSGSAGARPKVTKTASSSASLPPPPVVPVTTSIKHRISQMIAHADRVATAAMDPKETMANASGGGRGGVVAVPQ